MNGRFAIVCLVLHACAAAPLPKHSTASPEPPRSIRRDDVRSDPVLPARDPRREVRDALLATVRASLTDLNVERYVAGWMPDGESISGRGPERDRYDLRLDLSRVRAMRSLAVGLDPKRRVEVEDEQIVLQRDRATVIGCSMPVWATQSTALVNGMS